MAMFYVAYLSLATPCARGTGYGMLMAKELCRVMRQLANKDGEG